MHLDNQIYLDILVYKRLYTFKLRLSHSLAFIFVLSTNLDSHIGFLIFIIYSSRINKRDIKILHYEQFKEHSTINR